TSDGGFIVAGFSGSDDGDVSGHHGIISTSDYWIVKLDTLGTIVWQKSLGGSGIDNAYSCVPLQDKGFIVAGSSASVDGDATTNHGTLDYWIVKLGTNGNIEWQK